MTELRRSGDGSVPDDVFNELVAYVETLSGGGGGSQPQQGVYYGNVDVEDANSAPIPFQFLDGDALLDITDPTAPTFVADGWYTVTIFFSTDQFTPAGFGRLYLPTMPNGSVSIVMPQDVSGTGAVISASYTRMQSEGDPMGLVAENNDGGMVTRSFFLDDVLIVKFA